MNETPTGPVSSNPKGTFYNPITVETVEEIEFGSRPFIWAKIKGTLYKCYRSYEDYYND